MRSLAILFAAASIASAQGFRAGAAAVAISPPVGTPMAGYYSTRLSTGVHDDLHAKAIVLEAAGQRAALVACDLVGIPPSVIEEAREIEPRHLRPLRRGVTVGDQRELHPVRLQRLDGVHRAREHGGLRLAIGVETLAERLKSSTFPRSLIAEQIGNLLALATGAGEGGDMPGPASRHRGQLTRQILRRIENDYADPDLTPNRVAADCGISKSYLQTLLAGSGTSFVQELNATRLERAADMLSDPRSQSLAIGDIAYRTGFLDPGYFTRLFRKRFGITPREWRAGHAPQS